MKRKHHRIKKGYAGGGPVTASSYGTASDTSTTASSLAPAIMSNALDSRSHQPEHFSEDMEPISTRPEGAPSAPEEVGYKNGGPVRKTGYASGGEVYGYQDQNQEEGDDEEQDGETFTPVRAEEDDAAL